MNEHEIRQIVETVVDRMLAASSGGAETQQAARGGVVALGADHGGFEKKQRLRAHLEGRGLRVLDKGCHSKEAVDYPDIAREVGLAVARGEAARGIILDGAGIGSCMAANKVKGVRAALCWNDKTIVNSVSHNNANVLSMGAPFHEDGELAELVDLWLGTTFEGGRHQRRVDKIMQLESDCGCGK